MIETVFSASSLLFILAPLYVAVGFGWLKKTARLDAMVSISMLVSACVYLVMFLRGDFANMLMLMVPVLVNTVLMGIACWYENAGQKLTVNQQRLPCCCPCIMFRSFYCPSGRSFM